METTQVSTETLAGAALDWSVAWAAIKSGAPMATIAELDAIVANPARRTFRPTQDWGVAGALLEGLRIDVAWFQRRQADGRMVDTCRASIRIQHTFQNYRSSMSEFGNDASDERVAKLRCYVATRLGLQVAVPTSLLAHERDQDGPRPVDSSALRHAGAADGAETLAPDAAAGDRDEDLPRQRAG